MNYLLIFEALIIGIIYWLEFENKLLNSSLSMNICDKNTAKSGRDKLMGK